MRWISINFYAVLVVLLWEMTIQVSGQTVDITRIEEPNAPAIIDQGAGFTTGDPNSTATVFIGQLVIDVESDSNWVLSVSAVPVGVIPSGVTLEARRGGAGAGAYTTVTNADTPIGSDTGDVPGVIVDYRTVVTAISPPGNYQFAVTATVTAISP